jgi:hypothetical protein
MGRLERLPYGRLGGLAAFVAAVGWAPGVAAESTGESADVTSYDLEALLATKVESSTKTAQKASEARTSSR